nr:glutamate--cysteine ligase, chloroplastic isoform X4 [Arachis hypogaea]XP_025698655.1 glutamate--cysteine ligase, chloroplastic isoform X4 [Arachis hypogaea]
MPDSFQTLRRLAQNREAARKIRLRKKVRLKRYMEMRGADGGTSDMLCALPAFWVGLLHDEDFLHNALDIIVHWTPEERQNLRNMARSCWCPLEFVI